MGGTLNLFVVVESEGHCISAADVVNGTFSLRDTPTHAR